MIDLLLLTNESDYSLDRVIHWLYRNEPELRVQRINRERTAPLGGISAVLGRPGWGVQEPPRVAWLRQLLPERDPYGPSPTPAEIDDILVCRRQWFGWTHLFSDLGTRWMNDPERTYRAESKVRQLSAAGRAEFDVPRTLLTCNRDDAQSFTSEFGPCIVKSVATAFWEFSDQSFVFTADAEDALVADAESWQAQPVFVQERIDGSHDARLFVIGGYVLGAYRRRASLDWRTDPDVAWARWEPDRETAKRAVSFARELGLDYGAFDFILGSNAYPGPVFLECNPAGEFGFLDDVLDRQPSRMIGRLLARLASDDGRSAVGDSTRTSTSTGWARHVSVATDPATAVLTR